MTPREKIQCPDCKHPVTEHTKQGDVWVCSVCKKTCQTTKK